MTKFTYNDAEYTVEPSGYDVRRLLPNGSYVLIGSNLFPGMSAAEADTKAKALIKTAEPVGVKVVGPDTSRPLSFGDLKIVGPDTSRPNFVYWDKDSTSFPKNS